MTAGIANGTIPGTSIRRAGRKSSRLSFACCPYSLGTVKETDGASVGSGDNFPRGEMSKQSKVTKGATK